MHWNRICYGTRLICHTTICWFIWTRNLRKDNICKGAQLESCLSRMNGPHIGSLSRGVSVQIALKAPILKVNKSCVLVDKNFIILELVTGGSLMM